MLLMAVLVFTDFSKSVADFFVSLIPDEEPCMKDIAKCCSIVRIEYCAHLKAY